MKTFGFHNLLEDGAVTDKVHMRNNQCSLLDLGGNYMNVSFKIIYSTV